MVVQKSVIIIKILFREFCYAIFPLMRGMYVLAGFKFNFRDFKQGMLKAEVSLHEFKEHLFNEGFEKNKLAWKCKDEILNVRKRLQNGKQYHIRVFKDGLVNGHYEWSPEVAPIKHYYQTLLEPNHSDFQKMLGNFLIFK